MPQGKFAPIAVGCPVANCSFPQLCIAESKARRYCSDSLLDAVHGRTIFDYSAERVPGLYHCERCNAPLLNVDFGASGDIGTNECKAECRLPVGGATDTHIGESFMTSNCLTTCGFIPYELYGDAVLGSSAYHGGYEPSDDLWVARAAAAAAKDGAALAADEAQAAAAAATAAAAETAVNAEEIAELWIEAERPDDCQGAPQWPPHWCTAAAVDPALRHTGARASQRRSRRPCAARSSLSKSRSRATSGAPSPHTSSRAACTACARPRTQAPAPAQTAPPRRCPTRAAAADLHGPHPALADATAQPDSGRERRQNGRLSTAAEVSLL